MDGRRRSLVRLVAILLGLLLAAPAFGQGRVALVIGNSSYRHVPELPNTVNDAADVVASFTRLGFAVQRVQNGGYDAMRRALLDFSRRARDAEMAVVYFAGHGMEVGGENWLIPIDAELKTDLDAEQEAISLKAVMLTVSAASRLGLVVLDACRNNPFAARMQRSLRSRAVDRGFARVEPTGSVLVAFAARDGTTAADGAGRNSPFTEALLRHLETPGLEINFLFRNVRDDVIAATRRQQEPFVYGSLSKETIYLKAPVPVVLAPPPPASPAPDEITWNFLKDTSDTAAISRFIEQFPKSPLRSAAETRLAMLNAKPVEKPAPPPVTSPPPAPTADEITWNFLKDTDDPAAIGRFIEQFPQSPLRSVAETRLATLSARPPVEKAAPDIQIDRREVARSLQLELRRVGCFEGRIDGEFGTATRTALRNFAKLAAVDLKEDEPSLDALKAVRAIDKRVCPLICPSGERAEADRCVRIVCPAGEVLRDGACIEKPAAAAQKRPNGKPAPRVAPSPAPKGRCFAFQGRQFCE